MNDSNKKIWFRAKSYGFGWGLPVTWEGWLVFLGYFVLLISGISIFLDRGKVFEFTVFTSFITGIFLGLCWAKGEKLKWRWGRE